jgi:hypothetical protein
MKITELIFEAGKRLAKQGVEVSRVNKQDFLTAKAALDPLLKKAGIVGGWTSGGAGSFDPEHPYGGGGREDSGDIDIMIDPQNLLQRFPKDIEEYAQEFNQTSAKPIGAKALSNAMADPDKKAKLQMTASKWALASYMTNNGFRTDPGTLTVEYSAGGKTFSVDLLVRPKESWDLHTHDFATDTTMRGGDLWVGMYPTLAKLASQKTYIDPKTGEEKGNLQLSPDRGLVDRDTNKVIAINKDDIAKILLGPNATGRDMASISGIKKALASQPEKLSKLPQPQPQ